MAEEQGSRQRSSQNKYNECQVCIGLSVFVFGFIIVFLIPIFSMLDYPLLETVTELLGTFIWGLLPSFLAGVIVDRYIGASRQEILNKLDEFRNMWPRQRVTSTKYIFVVVSVLLIILLFIGLAVLLEINLNVLPDSDIGRYEGPGGVNTVFRAFPFVLFSLLLVFPRLTNELDYAVTKYFGKLLHKPYEEGWRYKHLFIFLYDKIRVKYVLVVSLLYTIVLHTVILYQSDASILIIPIIGSFVLLNSMWIGVNKWFNFEDGRNPDAYYAYYYENRVTPPMEDIFMNSLLPSSVDKLFSPVYAALYIQLFLIGSSIGLGLVNKSYSAGVSIVMLVGVVLCGYLVTPRSSFFN